MKESIVAAGFHSEALQWRKAIVSMTDYWQEEYNAFMDEVDKLFVRLDSLEASERGKECKCALYVLYMAKHRESILPITKIFENRIKLDAIEKFKQKYADVLQGGEQWKE